MPYEVARSGGHFLKHGIDMELVYTRGGSAAMNALVGGAVDYAGSALDVAIQAYAKGAEIRRFAVTGHLPLFALVTAPKTADTIKSVKDLEGKTVGVSALGNADHALLLYLLKEAKADAAKVQFATLGVNLLEALPIAIDDETGNRAFSDIRHLARTYQLSAYDAAYLELAVRRGLPMACLDGKLKAAATAAGVLLFTPA